MYLDPRIGYLNSGAYYAFAHGYDAPETVGTLSEVEAALGLRPTTTVEVTPAPAPADRWDVVIRFQYPAWDEIDGILYPDICAASKSKANAIVRTLASNDGHLGRGKGRITLTATPSE